MQPCNGRVATGALDIHAGLHLLSTARDGGPFVKRDSAGRLLSACGARPTADCMRRQPRWQGTLRLAPRTCATAAVKARPQLHCHFLFQVTYQA
jgi:hypothetical protein